MLNWNSNLLRPSTTTQSLPWNLHLRTCWNLNLGWREVVYFFGNLFGLAIQGEFQFFAHVDLVSDNRREISEESFQPHQVIPALVSLELLDETGAIVGNLMEVILGDGGDEPVYLAKGIAALLLLVGDLLQNFALGLEKTNHLVQLLPQTVLRVPLVDIGDDFILNFPAFLGVVCLDQLTHQIDQGVALLESQAPLFVQRDPLRNLLSLGVLPQGLLLFLDQLSVLGRGRGGE